MKHSLLPAFPLALLALTSGALAQEAAPEAPNPAPSEAPAPVPSEAPPAPSEPAPPNQAQSKTPAKPASAIEGADADKPAETKVATESKPTEPAQEAPASPASAPATETSAAEEQNEVVVLGAKAAEVPGSIQVITSKQLERQEYDDPGAILTQVPGVYMRTEDGVGLRPNIGVRGVNPDRSKKITLMEDGVLFGPAPYSAPAAYFFPLMTRMTSIRVIKGPGSVAYGPQTVGGAVDFISRAIPGATAGYADVAIGDFGYTKGHVYFGSSTDQTGFLLEGIHLHDSGFKYLESGADTGQTRNEWVLKASHILDPRAAVQNTFSFKGSYNDEASNETYLGLTDADFRKDPDLRYPASALDRMTNHRTGVVIGHLLSDPKSRFELDTKAYRFDYARVWKKVNSMRSAPISEVLANPENPEYAPLYDVLRGSADSSNAAETILIGPNDRAFVSQGVQTVARVQLTTGPLQHSLETGVRLHYDSIRRRHSQSGYSMIGGQLYPDGSAEQVTTYDLDETFATAVHAMDGINWKNLTVTPGLRGEFLLSRHRDDLAGSSSQRTVAAFLPGAGVFYKFVDWFGVLGGAHRGYSPPAPGSDASQLPESSVNYEAGVRATGKVSRFEVIGFYNDYSNMTDVCTLASGCLDQNLDRQFSAGEASIYGVEVFGQHEFSVAAFRFPLTGSYTLTRAYFDQSFESADPIYGSVQAGDEVPYVPTHQGNVTFGVETDLARLNATANYTSRMREIAGSGEYDEDWTTDEVFTVDMAGEYRLTKWLRVYANLRNIADSRSLVSRRPYGARPNAPRWFQLGLKASF